MRWSKGFTLLETVVAMGVIAFVFMNLPGLLIVLQKVENENSLRAGALACAQEKTEELRFAAMAGRLDAEEVTEVLRNGPHARMERQWVVRNTPEAASLRDVSTSCSARGKLGAVRSEIRTMMFVDE